MNIKQNADDKVEERGRNHPQVLKSTFRSIIYGIASSALNQVCLETNLLCIQMEQEIKWEIESRNHPSPGDSLFFGNLCIVSQWNSYISVLAGFSCACLPMQLKRTWKGQAGRGLLLSWLTRLNERPLAIKSLSGCWRWLFRQVTENLIISTDNKYCTATNPAL